jgi:hypothetical protein
MGRIVTQLDVKTACTQSLEKWEGLKNLSLIPLPLILSRMGEGIFSRKY